MNRRRFVLTSLAGAIATPLVAEAQRTAGLARVTMVYPGRAPEAGQRGPLVNAFVRGMRDNGYAEGQNFVLEIRYTAGMRTEDAARVIGELLPLKPDVIVTVGSQVARAAKAATSTVPIVMATAADPIGQGLVSSLAQPGGNITGNAILAEVVVGKRLEIVHELLPNARRIGYLQNSSNPVSPIVSAALERSATALAQIVVRFDVATPRGLTGALAELAQQRPDAVIVAQDSEFYIARTTLVPALSQLKIPTMYAFKEHVVEGGLMSYSNSAEAMFEKAAFFVTRILRGARPSDLPVEQATKFEFVINVKAAKALGLTIPASLLLRADHVVE